MRLIGLLLCDELLNSSKGQWPRSVMISNHKGICDFRNTIQLKTLSKLHEGENTIRSERN